MSILLMQVDWTGNSGETISFTDIESLNVKRSSESKASYANITLKNPMDQLVTGFSYPLHKYVSNSNSILFNEGDTVKIYLALVDTVRSLDTTSTSTDLIMTGEVSEVKGKSTSKLAKLTLKVLDKTWVMLNKLYVFNYKLSDAWTSPKVIQDVVRQVMDDVEQDEVSFDTDGTSGTNKLYSVDARLESAYPTDGYIEDTRQDATAFPKINMVKIYKPAYEFITEISTKEYTNNFDGRDSTLSTDDEDAPVQNRTMLFYIDERNRFHWFYPSDTVGADLTFIDGDSSTGNIIIDSNLTYTTFDITNFVFFNAGKDLNGNGISSFFYDQNSKEKDFKQVNKPYTEIAKDLIDAEIKIGNLIRDNAQTDFTYEGNFYKSDTYGFDTTWGIDTTGFSDADYNTSLRSESITTGKSRASKLVDKKGSPRWKGSIQCKFKAYNVGDLIEYTSTKLGINEVKLRIISVIYNITKSGGFSTLSVEEDERKIGD